MAKVEQYPTENDCAPHHDDAAFDLNLDTPGDVVPLNDRARIYKMIRNLLLCTEVERDRIV